MSVASAWAEPAALMAWYPELNSPAGRAWINLLIQNGMLVVEGTPAAAIDADYEQFWKWDTTAGFYHFALKDPPYMTTPQAAQWMAACGATQAEVPLYSTNAGYPTVIDLPAPRTGEGMLEILNRRRSVRAFSRREISTAALGDCLYAGLGITGFLDTQIVGSRRLPLKMTPSGGARNPYEGYAYVNRVAGIRRGLYHYSATENSLGLLTEKPGVSVSELLVGQSWGDDCSAVVLLAANFERTMWKYPSAVAYRVVLIEAGHIAQNISVAAASHGLTTTPTAALNDSAAHRLLRLDWIRQSLVYAIQIGYAEPDAFEYRNFIPWSPRRGGPEGPG